MEKAGAGGREAREPCGTREQRKEDRRRKRRSRGINHGRCKLKRLCLTHPRSASSPPVSAPPFLLVFTSLSLSLSFFFFSFFSYLFPFT